MGESVLITGVGEEGMMKVELGTEQEEQKKEDCSNEVRDDHDGCSTKDVIRWEKFLPRMVLRVLLVEADDSTRQIIAALLRKCCYRVAAVADGLKAWETLKMKSDDIDLILTEVELPSISGFALLTLVMEHNNFKNIPVIMMSSHDSISMALKCMLKGAADFLIKPVRRNELRNLWQHVWRRHAQKIEATSENNAASCHSGDCVGHTQNEKCNDKESYSQISCTTHFMEAENAYMENMQGVFQLKSKSTSNLSNDGVQRNIESTKIDKEMDLFDIKFGEEAAVCWEALNLKSMEAEEDHGSVKTIIQDKIVRPECIRGNARVSVQAHGLNNEVVASSREAVDLIGTIDQVLRTTDGNTGVNHQRNKFSKQLLELTLRNGPSELNQQPMDERQALKHSNTSAFSWYSSKPVQCISSLYPEGSAKRDSSDQHGFTSHEHHSTSTIFAQSGQAESKLPGHDNGLIPVSEVIFHDKCSGQGQVIPSMLCQDSGVRWNINQECHPENSAFSPNASFQSNDPQNCGSEHSFHGSADAANNPIMLENPHDVKNLVPKEEVRHGSSPANQSANIDPANHINGSSYGSMANGSDGNDYSAMTAGSARGSFDDGTCSMHDVVRTDCLCSSKREAALIKFRLKRKDRCFEKKVRYQSRKRLAEQRPRVKGQFVRQAHTDPSLADTG